VHEDPTVGAADTAEPVTRGGSVASVASPSHRLRPVALGGVIAATVVVAAAWVVGGSVLLTAATAPSVMLQPYLDALEDGHLERAVAMDGTAAAAAELGYSVDLLTDERYALATDRPTAYRVGATRTENGVATVDVAFERGGERQTEGDEMSGVTWLLTRGPEFAFSEYSATAGFLVTTTRRGSADFLAAFASASGEYGIVTAEDCEVWVDGAVVLSTDGTWTFAPYTS
jgi:hypothetical protein